MISGACQTGYAPYLSSSTSQPVACATNQLTNYCPQGYVCQTANAGSFQGYCCSQNRKKFRRQQRTSSYLINFCFRSLAVCPSGSSVYINAQGSTQACTIGGFGTPCPSPYVCQTNVAGSINGFCCSSAGTSDIRPLFPKKLAKFSEFSDLHWRRCSLQSLR